MRRAFTIPLLLAALAPAVAGCGGSSKSSSSSGGGATTARTTGSNGEIVTIAMKNIQFEPSNVTIKLGQTVVWTNEDSIDHNVRATSTFAFQSTDFGKGGTFNFKPTHTGTITYVCTLHPGMDGKITVVK